MIKEALQNLAGSDWYAILSLGLFMSFFIGMLVWVFFLRKSHVRSMSELPLENTEPEIGESDDESR